MDARVSKGDYILWDTAAPTPGWLVCAGYLRWRNGGVVGKSGLPRTPHPSGVVPAGYDPDEAGGAGGDGAERTAPAGIHWLRRFSLSRKRPGSSASTSAASSGGGACSSWLTSSSAISGAQIRPREA